MSNVGIGYPDWTQPTVSATPDTSGGSWPTLGSDNALDPDLSLVARSADTELSSTRAHIDLGASRAIGLVAIPKHTLSKSGAYVRYLVRPTSLLLGYEAGDDITTIAGSTFTRADSTTCARYIDRNGIYRTVAAGVLRESNFPSTERSTLIEDSSTNLCLQSEDFGTTWAAVGTPSRSAAAHTAAGVTLDLIGDDDGAALEGYTQAIAYTGDAVKSVSVHVKKGSATSTVIRVRDTTAGADRLLAAITWSGSTPVVTMTTGTHARSQTMADGVYRIAFLTATVTAANTNSLQVYPATDAALATTATGTIYAGGVQATDRTHPTSYVKTTTLAVTRAEDSLLFDFDAVPQEMTVYVKFRELGTIHSAGSMRIFQLGGAVAPFVSIFRNSSNYRAQHDNGSATVTTANTLATPTVGDLVEHRLVLNSNGSVLLGQSINGGAEATTATTAANTLAGAWGDDVFAIASTGGNTVGSNAFISVRVMAGVQTLATMQAAVYDSGWIDAWPTGLSAEDADGINVPWVHKLSSAQTARYCSLQIDDYSNSAGYIDIARLFIAKLYTPTANMRLGPELVPDDETERKTTDGGADVHNVKSMRRRMRFALPRISEAEAFSDAYRIQRQAGIHKQMYFIYDDGDSDEMMAERSFLGTLEKTSPLVQPTFDRHEIVFDGREAL